MNWPDVSTLASRGALVSTLASLLVFAACGSDDEIPQGDATDATDVIDDTDATDVIDDTDATDDTAPTPRPFALGVEYTEHGLGEVYGAAGVRWAKTHLEEFGWGAIETDPPVGGVASYDWRCADDTVRTWQAAGVDHLMSYLVADSAWGSTRVEMVLGKPVVKDAMPRPELMASYVAWVTALVERYDHDGVDDMPGLTAPVRHWVVGGEWTGFWPSGDAADYLELLARTRAAIHVADATAEVGLIPFMLVDVFEGRPDAATIAQRLTDPPPFWRQSTAGMMTLLSRPDLFDFVAVHSLGDYTELPQTIAFFEQEMRDRGYSRPIWLDDAFPMSHLANLRLAPGTGYPDWYPVTAATHDAVLATLVAVAKTDDPASGAATRWVRDQVANGLVKKTVVAAGLGVRGLLIGNTEDWMHDSAGGLRHATVNLIGAAAMMGLVDVSHPDGLAPCARRVAGQGRPALRNLERLLAAMTDLVRVDALTGLPPEVWAYRVTRARGPMIVAWREDGVLELPGVPEASARVKLPVPFPGTARVTGGATSADPAPTPKTVAIVDGAVEVELGPVPLFIEP